MKLDKHLKNELNNLLFTGWNGDYFKFELNLFEFLVSRFWLKERSKFKKEKNYETRYNGIVNAELRKGNIIYTRL